MPTAVEFSGIVGGSTDSQHRGAFECSSFSWGAGHNGNNTGGGGGAGRSTFDAVEIVMPLQLRTPELMLAAINGRVFQHVTLFSSLIGGDREFDVQTIHFTDVVLRHWNETGNGDLPAVQFTFEYAHAQVVTQFQNPDGNFATDTVAWNTR